MLTEDDRQFLKEQIRQPERRIYGFKIQEWILFITFIFGAGLNASVLMNVVKNSTWLMKFAENSDAYHGEIHGKRFYQGEPVDKHYDLKPIRRLLEDTTNGTKGKVNL